jgi:2-iminobutanoate/2-iminopropanoate deaminase
MRTLTVSLLCFVLGVCAFAADKKVIQPPGTSTNMFSPGLLVDGTLYVSGSLGQDPKTRAIPDKFEDEVKFCLESIGAVLKAAGMDYSDVVSSRVYLTDPALFRPMNEVYSTFFKDPKPARTTVIVTLASKGAHIEVDVVARK